MKPLPFVFSMAVLLLASAFGVGPAVAQDLELVVGNSSGLPDSDVQVPVDLAANSTQPSTLSFSLVYDDAKLDLVSVQEGAIVPAANKQVTSIEGTGQVNLVVAGGRDVLESGRLMMLTFQVLGAAVAGDVLPIAGDNSESAADPNANAIPVAVVPGSITVEEPPATHTLTTAVRGPGRIDPPAGANPILVGETVRVSAIANSGWQFDHWEGALTGSKNPTNLTMNSDLAVTAVFVQRNAGIQCPAARGSTSAGNGSGLLSVGLLLLVCRLGARWIAHSGHAPFAGR